MRKKFAEMTEAEIFELCTNVVYSDRPNNSKIKRYLLRFLFPKSLCDEYVFNNSGYYISLRCNTLWLAAGNTSYSGGGEDYTEMSESHTRIISDGAKDSLRKLLVDMLKGEKKPTNQLAAV
jgi:hypothetical protein